MSAGCIGYSVITPARIAFVVSRGKVVWDPNSVKRSMYGSRLVE